MVSIKNFSFLYRYYYLLLIPIIVIALFSRVFVLRPKAMQIAIAGKSFPYPNPPKRIFQTVHLRGDEFDSSKMEYFKTLIVEIYKRKDTTYGVQLNFDIKTEYQHIVRALDLCHIFDLPYYCLDPESNLFWACYAPPKIYKPYDGEIDRCGCGGCFVKRQVSIRENLVSHCESYFNFFKDFHKKEGQFYSEFSHTVHNN